MKKTLITSALAMFSVLAHSQVPVASDSGLNYPNNTWTSGSNGGTGFTPWSFNITQGTGAAGVFIGDPLAAGITGMSASSFGFYANPLGSGANAEVSRGFAVPLLPSQVFSFEWGLNWDSNSASSNRGFSLLHGAAEIINVNMGNSAEIRINGQVMFSQYGTQAFVLNFEQLTPTSVRVYGTGRDGVETYDNTFSNLLGQASGFKFYFNATEANATPRQMYVNDLEIVPEPNATSLIFLSAVGLFAYRYSVRRRSHRL